MTTLDAKTLTGLRQVLSTYLSTYGGETMAEIRAIAGSILSVKAKAGDLLLQGLEMEAWVDEMVKDFAPGEVVEPVSDAGMTAIATQTKNWRDTLEVKTRATLDAYIQNYAPHLNTEKLRDLVTTILPIVEDAQISRDEALRVIQQVGEQCDPQSALGRVLDTQWVTLASKVQQVLQNRDLEDTVQDVMQAYVHKFEPALVEIGTGLIADALRAVTNSKAMLDLDLDWELDAETQQLVIRQVGFKMQLLKASPPPSKTALEIAQQVHSEVRRYRAEQGLDDPHPTMPTVVRTDDDDGESSRLGGDLSVGIQLQPGQEPSENASHTDEPTQN